MVPLIWAFFSADVNAGTASAARIAIIAITTNNSIRVNAEEVLFVLFIFIGVCSEWRGLSHSSQIKSILIFDLFAFHLLAHSPETAEQSSQKFLPRLQSTLGLVPQKSRSGHQS